MPFVLAVGVPRSVDETPAIATEHVQWLCDTVQPDLTSEGRIINRYHVKSPVPPLRIPENHE